ncbi:MAG: amidohydrolase family protein [Planctomycetes bacterium]|nr:amidohydrolase family protein [Planctomycetota bacterium]
MLPELSASRRLASLAALALLVSAGPAAASTDGGGERFALRTAKALVCPPTGPQVVDNALVVVADGKIEAVGPAATTPVPEGYDLVDVGDRWVVPGFVELHCHVAGPNMFAVNDINDMVYLTNPGLRASSAVIPSADNVALRMATAGGVTTVLYIPGSGTNMGGQGVLLKTGLDGYTRMLLRDPGSLKLAQAGNPERWLIRPGRSFMNWNTRNTFLRGIAYAKRWARQVAEGERPRVEPQFEIFRALYEGRAQVSTHTQIYQVVLMTITMVSQELGLPVYIDHGTFDGHRAAALAEANDVFAILGPRGISRHYSGFVDTDGRILGVAAEYQREGHTRIGFNTDSPVIPEEQLSLQSAMGVRYGLDTSHLEHVRGLTIVPALAAGTANRVGSLEVGKDADLLVVTGDPADPRTSVEMTFIEGERVYDAARDGRRW